MEVIGWTIRLYRGNAEEEALLSSCIHLATRCHVESRVGGRGHHEWFISREIELTFHWEAGPH
jgi:hypothetical protein